MTYPRKDLIETEPHISVQNTISGWKAAFYQPDPDDLGRMALESFGLMGHRTYELALCEAQEWGQSYSIPVYGVTLERFYVRFQPDGETIEILSVKDEDGKWIDIDTKEGQCNPTS